MKTLVAVLAAGVAGGASVEWLPGVFALPFAFLFLLVAIAAPLENTAIGRRLADRILEVLA